MNGSGGIGAVSVSLPEWAIWLAIPVVIALVGFGVWKLVKFFWAVGG